MTNDRQINRQRDMWIDRYEQAEFENLLGNMYQKPKNDQKFRKM